MKSRLVVPSVYTFIMTLTLLITVPDTASAHGKEKHTAGNAKGDVTYTDHIAPLFKKRCAKCHGANSPVHMEFVKDMNTYRKKMKGPRMDSYADLVTFIVWPDTGSLMRALDDGKQTETSRPGKMYKYLGKTEEERQENLHIFKKWVGNWILSDWTEISKDNINKMNLSY